MNPPTLAAKPYAFLKEVLRGFFDDGCMQMAAALSYYAVFSLPPLLFLLVAVLGYFFQSEVVRHEVSQNLANVIGKENAGLFESMLGAAHQGTQGDIAGSIVGIVVLAAGASVMMSELQSALNKTWEVEPSKQTNGILDFFCKKLIALSMLLIVAGLLLFSLLFSTVISAFGDGIEKWLSSRSYYYLLRVIHFTMSYILLTLLFALAFKILPSATVRWKDVWLGAVVTTILFGVGNYAVGLYLAHSHPASAYGAAASLAVILVWIYYAAMIVLLGAEFTRAWARRRHLPEEANRTK